MQRFPVVLIAALGCCAISLFACSRKEPPKSLEELPSPSQAVSNAACTGLDLDRTVDLVQRLYLAGQQMAASGDFSQMFPVIEAGNQELATLSPACQKTFEIWSKIITRGGPSQEGPMCQGGVCCEQSGCYGG